MKNSLPKTAPAHQVEIFKTNVTHTFLANTLIQDLHTSFPAYRVNFDLEDSDNVLRIESTTPIDVTEVVNFGKEKNIEIELIP